MKICKKMYMGYEELIENGPITIVAFGDSVTHGAVAEDEINYETVYWNRLRKKLIEFRNYVPINVINAGIGGITANGSLERMETQVLAHNPDLVIVCFGLNDVNEELSVYLNALKIIFQRCMERGIEVIFMTPNMFNTYVHENTPKRHFEYAGVTAEMQNCGKMDTYMEAAVVVAKEMGVKVCDCYAKWKELAKVQDVTVLLANYINHPTKEMHELFANSLYETIFEDETLEDKEKNSTMYGDNH